MFRVGRVLAYEVKVVFRVVLEEVGSGVKPPHLHIA